MADEPRLLTAEKLEEIRRCVDAAPPGPYEHYQSAAGFWHITHPGERNRILADLPWHPRAEAIAALMAYSRQDVPALLAHIATQAALLAAARAALEPFVAESFVFDVVTDGLVWEWERITADDLLRVADVLVKMEEVPPDGR